MAQLIFGHDEALAQWAEDRWPDFRGIQRPLRCIGYAHGDELMAVAIYNYYFGHDIRLSMAAVTPRWATKGSIRALFAYPFHDIGVKRITSVTAKDNKRARRMLERIGFKIEGVHPMAEDGVRTAISYGITHNSPKLKEWFG